MVILDFASLYPSLFRSYNLCYTTLLHPDDVSNVSQDGITTSPTGVCSCKRQPNAPVATP